MDHFLSKVQTDCYILDHPIAITEQDRWWDHLNFQRTGNILYLQECLHSSSQNTIYAHSLMEVNLWH
jgi:hypothetical protein